MNKAGVIVELNNFSSNLAACMNGVFKMYLKDLSVISRIPLTTLSTYRQGCDVSPPISSCMMIAKTFCTSLDRMCGGNITDDAREVVRMQEDYIRRAGGLERNQIDGLMQDFAKVFKTEKFVSESALCLFLKNQYLGLFKFLNVDIVKDALYEGVNECAKAGPNFIGNLNKIIGMTETTQTELVKSTGVSRGTLRRYFMGAEPSLGFVVAIAEYFDMTITEILSDSFVVGRQNVIEKNHRSLSSVGLADCTNHPRNENEYEAPNRCLMKDEASEFVRSHVCGLAKGG